MSQDCGISPAETSYILIQISVKFIPNGPKFDVTSVLLQLIVLC